MGFFLKIGLVFLLVFTCASRADLASALRTISRRFVQDQGAWRIYYEFEYRGEAVKPITPETVELQIKGAVSNSAVPRHGTPGPIAHEIFVSGATEFTGKTRILPAENPGDPVDECHEKATLKVFYHHRETATFELRDRDTFGVEIYLEHLHEIYGEYEPLLGRREILLKMNGLILLDELDLRSSQYSAHPTYALPDPACEWRDAHFFLKPPHSYYVDESEAFHYLEFSHVPVKAGSRLSLEFYYFVAERSAGDIQFEMNQYSIGKNHFKSRPHVKENLPARGRWTKINRKIEIDSSANALTLVFRITDSPGGDLWIDEISLHPIGGVNAQQP
jgi:hypothetical protein